MDPTSGADRASILVWNAETGTQLRALDASALQGRINVVAWSPDGRLLAAGSHGGQTVLWDMTSYVPAEQLLGHAGVVTGLAWSPDSRQLATAAQDGTLLIWNVP